ncbi:MAG: hypothetical protein ABII71_01815 [Candidatus Micrarchaeota archaeon]
MEFYCEDGNAQYEYLLCPAGYLCTGGSCVKVAGAPGATCDDSELTNSIYSAGKVSVVDAAGETILADACVDDNILMEYSCDGSKAVSKSSACPSGYTCFEGACQAMGACFDSDGGGSGGMYVSGTVFSEFGSYSDYCTSGTVVNEYSCVSDSRVSDTVACPSGYLCRGGACVSEDDCYDSDDGLNYYAKGTAEVHGIDEVDYCTDSDTVREYYCGSGDEILSATYSCPGGYECSGGRCVREGSGGASCTDSDGGHIYAAIGTTSTTDGDVGRDVCLSSGLLREYFCDGDDLDSETYSCPLGQECSGGRCVAAGEEVTCDDSDGLDYYTVGSVFVTGDDLPAFDYCEDGDILREYVCDGSERDYESHACESGMCREARCVEMTCQDTDGRDYSVQGAYGHYYDGMGMLEEERCADVSTVMEYYCSDGVLTMDRHDCAADEVCSDGACVEADICADSDGTSTNTKGTVTFGTESRTDYCTEFGQIVEWVCRADPADGFQALVAVNCPSGKYCDDGRCVSTWCTDSDDGNNIDVAGSVADYLGHSDSDECYGADGARVLEYFCDADKELDFEYVHCPSGSSCVGGRCLDYVCTDTDGGVDPLEGGSASSTDGSSGVDDCWAGGIYEAYCAADNSVEKEWIACSANYECRYSAGGSACVPTCYEDAEGDVHFGSEFHPDTCSGDHPIDYYCVDDYSYDYHFMSCTFLNMCVGGECVPRPPAP